MAKAKRQITDRELLKLVSDGRLEVDTAAGTVYTLVPGRGRRRKLATVRSDGYSVINIYIGNTRTGRRRKVMLHKLVWMVANARTVPWGYDVHHKIADLANNGANNLELQKSGPHRAEARRGGWQRTRAERAEASVYEVEEFT